MNPRLLSQMASCDVASTICQALKGGMCYGKAECAALFFVIPLTLLG